MSYTGSMAVDDEVAMIGKSCCYELFLLYRYVGAKGCMYLVSNLECLRHMNVM
jgi:hypothetical protein